MKKVLSVLLGFVLLLLSAVGVSAATADVSDTGKTIITIGDWVYEAIDGGKNWEVDGYLGDGGDIVIERIINDKMVTTLGDHCFVNNTTVRSVKTGSPLWTVGEYAFLNCTSIERFECNFALKEIEVGAFCGTSSLRSIDLEKSVVTVIRPHVFMSSGITEVQLPETCTEIMHDAFSQCPNLVKIVIPRSVTVIDDAAFSYSDNLTIYCYTDSAAHEYALAKNIPFVLIDGSVEVTFLLGDADGSGEVTILDATKIQRVLVDLDPDPDGMIALRGHTYGEDDELNIMDATVIQRYLAGFAVSDDFNTQVTRTITPSGV